MSTSLDGTSTLRIPSTLNASSVSPARNNTAKNQTVQSNPEQSPPSLQNNEQPSAFSLTERDTAPQDQTSPPSPLTSDTSNSANNSDTGATADPNTTVEFVPDAPTEVSATAFSKIVGRADPSIDGATTGSEALMEQVADKASFSFSDFLLTPAMTILNGMHDLTGLPWWMSIGLATFAIRGALMPFTLMTMKNSALMQALKGDIEYHRKNVTDAARSGDRLLANRRQAELQQFMSKAGVAPLRVLVGPLVQFPVFISFFVSIRRLAINDPSFVSGGTAWFTNLAVMDPTYVLPVVCGVTLLGMTELGGDTGSTKMSSQMRLFMRSVAVLSVPMTYWFPAAVFCYWIPNNLISMSLGAVMRRPAAKKALGLLVDPAKIPGTRANHHSAIAMAARGASAARANIDPAAAAASYMKRNRSAGASATEVVKPVLFKSKPSKKAKAGTQ